MDDAGFDRERVVEESFGAAPMEVAEGDPVTVTFRGSGTAISTERPGSLLQLAEQAGLAPRYGCRMGICQTCKCTKHAGQVRNVITGELSAMTKEDVQLCISVPVTDVELDL